MPALVLFSIGAIAATVGKLSWLVWAVSIAFGFIQSFTYAEIAGLFPNKSGGASIYGAIAWVRYAKVIAPTVGVVQLVRLVSGARDRLGPGGGLHSPHVLAPTRRSTPGRSPCSISGRLKTGLSLRINATFVLGAVISAGGFAIQHGGILRSRAHDHALASPR